MDGIVGIYSPSDNALVNKAFLATGACQHRGKASTGLAVGTGKDIYLYKGLGRIAEVIDLNVIRMLQHLQPVAAIGNIGYTKRKVAEKMNVEPVEIFPKSNSPLKVVTTMDGYLIQGDDLKAELESDYNFQTDNKTEIIGALLHKYLTEEGFTFEAGERLVDKLHGRGTFALTALVHDGKETCMIAMTDDTAFEPLCYATIDGAFVVCSESCSHRRLGGRTEKEYDGGNDPVLFERDRNKKTETEPDDARCIPGRIFRECGFCVSWKRDLSDQKGAWPGTDGPL